MALRLCAAVESADTEAIGGMRMVKRDSEEGVADVEAMGSEFDRATRSGRGGQRERLADAT